MLRPRDKDRLLWLLLIRPLCFRSHSGELSANDEAAHVDTDITGTCALAPVRIGRREFHLDRRDTAVRSTLKVGEIPARRDDVWPHALDRVHEHAGTLDRERFALHGDAPRRSCEGPEAVYHVAFWLRGIGTEVRVPPVWALANFESGSAYRPPDLERNLYLLSEVG